MRTSRRMSLAGKGMKEWCPQEDYDNMGLAPGGRWLAPWKTQVQVGGLLQGGPSSFKGSHLIFAGIGWNMSCFPLFVQCI